MQNQTRIIIENVSPQLDGGTFFIKRIVGQKVVVTANVFSDGHDVVACNVKFKHESAKKWQEIRMFETGNDEWKAEFKVEKQGFYTYLVEGWVDCLQFFVAFRVANSRHNQPNLQPNKYKNLVFRL